jgi:hypothetical protein
MWALVCLGPGSWGYGQCVNNCGTGDTAEGEPCLVDLDEDVTNAGCNSVPVQYSEISCGETVCGVISTYDKDTDGDGTADTDFRDTDWYLISQAELAAADLDGNNIVRLRATLVSEFPGLTFFIIFAPNCGSLGFPGTDGFSAPECGGGVPAEAFLFVSGHPGGVVAFVSTGNPDGGIFDGYECSTGLNDYTLNLECLDPPTACAPGPPQGPCGEAAFGVPGCEDPACCTQVCELPGLEFCCIEFWSSACATSAIELGCAEDPVKCMATGASPDVDGYLEVCPDAYGAWSYPIYGGRGDRFNPVGPFDVQAVAFSSGMFFFRPDELQRELLTSVEDWHVTCDDLSLQSELLGDVQELDTNGDGVTDALISVFRLWGPGVDLTFDLDQSVERIASRNGAVAAALTQAYTITNNLPTLIDFDLLRVYDGDLMWWGGYGDDSVGTRHASAANSVFMREDGLPETRITLSSPEGDGYICAKQGVDPDGPGPGPAMGFGTDTQEWDAYGIPEGWENFIPDVGYDTNGESGPGPSGCAQPCDAHLGLRIPVFLPPEGQVSITVNHGYGELPCPWDCQPDPDGIVNIPDFLAMLAQWGKVGTSCDLNGGGVDVTDFLEFLGNFGPCP